VGIGVEFVKNFCFRLVHPAEISALSEGAGFFSSVSAIGDPASIALKGNPIRSGFEGNM